jgi:TolB-like protein
MKRSITMVFALILAAALLPAAESAPASLTEAMDAMLESYWQPTLQAAFGSFTYAETELPSSFSRWIQDEMAMAITKCKRLTLFNKGAAVAMDADFRKVYADFFEDNMVGGLIDGKYYEESDRIRVRIKLTDLSTGNLIGVTDYYQAKKGIPSGVSIQPDKSAQETKQALSAVIAPAPSPAASSVKAEPLSVSVSTDRGKGAYYLDKERMVLFVTVNKDAYVKIYHVDVNGKVSLIYPNYLVKNVIKLKAGEAISMGTLSDGFNFELGPPFGTEFIKVIASTTPFTFTEKEFQDLGSAKNAVIAAGIGAAAGGEQAEALASYVIGPRK